MTRTPAVAATRYACLLGLPRLSSCRSYFCDLRPFKLSTTTLHVLGLPDSILPIRARYLMTRMYRYVATCIHRHSTCDLDSLSFHDNARGTRERLWMIDDALPNCENIPRDRKHPVHRRKSLKRITCLLAPRGFEKGTET